MMHSSVSSRAVSTCSSKAGAVSTTTWSNDSRRVRSTRVTRAGVTRSRASGCAGAASTIRDLSWRVSRSSSWSTSRSCSEPMACSIEWVGKSCMVIATSPKARSRSTRQTRRAPPSASARARLTAMVVLPTPPLGEKTVTTRPSWWAPLGPRSATCSSWARETAAATPAGSPWGTTSRAPACIARVSTAASTSARTSTTLTVGRVVRRSSQTFRASSRSRCGPSTTAYSSGCRSSQARIRSTESTPWLPDGSASSRAVTTASSVSVTTGIGAASFGASGGGAGSRAGVRLGLSPGRGSAAWWPASASPSSPR